MIKHFMTDYLGLLAYSDWLRDKGKEEEALAFLDAIMEERGWSEGSVDKSGDSYGSGYGYGNGHGDGYSCGDGYGYGYGNTNGNGNGDGWH